MQSDRASIETGTRPRWSPTLKVVVGVTLLVLFALIVQRVHAVLAPLIIGAIIAYLLKPVARLISRVTRLPHGIATGLLYLTLLAIVIPILALLTPVIINQVIFLQGELIRFLQYLDTLSGETIQIMGLELEVQELVNQITAALTDLITSAAAGSLSIVFGLAETLLLIIFTFLIGFYLTRDSDQFLDWFRGLIPYDYRSDFEALLSEIDRIWSAFFRGQLILATIVSGILTVVSLLLGLPQPVLMGVLGGVLEFLPSVGHAIWLTTALIIAGLEGSTYLPVNNIVFMLIVLGAHILYTQFDLNYLIPRIIGRQVHLHPMVVILGIIIGASIGGVLGVLLAAPTIASLRVIGRYIYANFFDLDPFPMVGPPSAPREEREAQAEQLAVTPPPVRPIAGAVIERVRRRPRTEDAGSGDPPAGDER